MANALRVCKFQATQAAKKASEAANPPAANDLRCQIPPQSISIAGAVSIQQELRCNYKCWPRRRMFIDKPCACRLRILQVAFKSMSKKVLYRKGVKEKRPTRLWFKWHYQVFLFLKLQIKQEQHALRGQDLFTGVIPMLESCKLLAQRVADGGASGWGSCVQDCIMSHEVQLVKKGFIQTPESQVCDKLYLTLII